MSGYRSPIGGKNDDQACSSRQQSLSLRTQKPGGLRMIRRDDSRPFSGGRTQASRRAVRDETALNEAARDGHAAREAGNTTMNAYTREDDDEDSAGHNNPPKNDIGNGNGRVSDRKPENRALSLTGWKRPSSYGPDCRNKAP